MDLNQMDLKKMMEQAKGFQNRFMHEYQEVMARHAQQLVHAETGAGMVRVTVNLRLEVLEIVCAPEVQQESVEVMQGLIKDALNAALTQARGEIKKDMQSLYQRTGMPMNPDEIPLGF